MCHLWQIDEGMAFAIHELDNLTKFLGPARRLQLARMYSIYSWVRPAITLLILGDFTFRNLSDDELHQITLKVYSITVRAREAMEQERKLIAAFPPRLAFERSWECTAHETLCCVVWKAFWSKKVAKKLLNAKDPMGLHQVVDFVVKHSRDLEMSAECRNAMIHQLNEGVLPGQAIVDGAIDSVVTYLKSLN